MADLKISSFGGLTTVAGDDEMVIVDKSDTTQAATGTTKKVQVQEAIQDVTHAATEKTTPVDADEVGLIDSAASYVLKRLTWAKLKIGIWAGMQSPRGFLLNGKIVPSVASNNLTVAIKGLDGNDPSATNPVYCRIGDTIRSITSALSVTKNAGTNWFNAGSAELATKEIDYFVYLGYNATDGVVIGFSRIPYANEYDDFSATTTSGKYCAISTITNAAAGDDYENIGRFAATLSAGAGYTWSVPTFTNKNLIQRPVFETRVLSYQPVYTALSSMTYSSITTTTSKYKVVGELCDIILDFTGTTGGTASAAIFATIPFNRSSASFDVAYGAFVNSIAGLAIIGYASEEKVAFQRYARDNFSLAAGVRCAAGSLLYEI